MSKILNKNDHEDHYSLNYVENLLGSVNEWRNIQDIVKITFKALTDSVRLQGNTIKELEKQLSSKATKSELTTALNVKANVADVLRSFSEVTSNIESRPSLEEVQSFLEEKISKSDLQYYLSSKASTEEVRNLMESKQNNIDISEDLNALNSKIEEVSRDLNKKLQYFPTNKDIANISQLLDHKASIKDLNESLNTKASKEQMTGFLNRKVNKADLDVALRNKVDIQDFQKLAELINLKLDSSDFEKFSSNLELKADKFELNNLANVLTYKVDKKEIENVHMIINDYKRENGTRLQANDQDFERLIDNIKFEFQSITNAIHDIEVKKIDFKDFEKVNINLSKKLDIDSLNGCLNQLKGDIYDSFNGFKHETSQNKKYLEEKIYDKIASMEKNMEKTHEELMRFRDLSNDLELKYESSQHDTLKIVKQILNSNTKEITADTNNIKSEIQKIYNELVDIINIKTDKKEFDLYNHKIFEDLEKKCDCSALDNLYKNLHKELNDKNNDIRQVTNQTFKNFEMDIHKMLEKKANLHDVTVMLNNKSDVTTTNLALQSKASNADLTNVKLTIDNLNKDISNKLDINKFESMTTDTFQAIEELQKDNLSKANIKEVLSLLKNKTDVDDVNKALTQIHEELDLKCSNENFNTAMDNQTLINDALCSENCVARWCWKSGQLKSGYAIPWESQSVNTAPDNFLWEKEKASVMVITPGLYEINMGFYSEKKPTVQLLVNGEPVLSAVNSAGYFVHQNSGKLKNVKHSGNNITGLTLIDFIAIPEKSRLSVSYSGEETGEGFMSLRKL